MLEELMEKMPRYYERIPEELQKVFDDLPLEMRILVTRELDRIQDEVFPCSVFFRLKGAKMQE